MNRIVGLVFFWLAADFVASLLSPGAQPVVGLIIMAVVLSVIGAQVLSAALGEQVSPGAGFMLAFPGWLLTQFVFGWHLINPANACAGDVSRQASCGFGVSLGAMLLNVCIVAIGMAIVGLPALPLIMKLRKR